MEPPLGHRHVDDSSSMDEMDTSSGGGGGGAMGGGFDAKGWGPVEEEEHDREFFENGEYLPSRIDTTQNSYHVVVSLLLLLLLLLLTFSSPQSMFWS